MRAHVSLSASQRAELCEEAPVEQPVGPAICSVAAKDQLRLAADSILSLCRGATSAGPIDCLRRLPVALRTNPRGFSLCAAAKTDLPALCFLNITSLHSKSTRGGSQQEQLLEEVVGFCSMLEDRLPLACAQAALLHFSTLSLAKTLLICSDTVGGDVSVKRIPQCIAEMRDKVDNSGGLTAERLLKFCAEINPEVYTGSAEEEYDDDGDGDGRLAAVSCFEESSHDTSLSKSLSAAHRLALCSNAPRASGPVLCAKALLSQRDNHLRPEEVVSLCRSATSIGPASCFEESRGLGDLSQRIALCNLALNAGPAHCYRRASSVFRKDEYSRLLLCVHAQSEGPAACVAAAPHYLTASEKVHLCLGATSSNSQDASKCLQMVQSLSPRFAQAPKKALGYFIENLQHEKDRASRQVLLQLCSFSDSQDPIAAAECFKSVPSMIEHDEAAMMCRNISSTEVIEHLLLCYRILPKRWSERPVRQTVYDANLVHNVSLEAPRSSASILCDGLTSRAAVEAAVKCAVDSSNNPQLHMSTTTSKQHISSSRQPSSSEDRLSLTLQDIAETCNHESSSENHVLFCLKQLALPQVLAAIHKKQLTMTNRTAIALCSAARSSETGRCLVAVSQYAANHHQVIDSEVIVHLCGHSQDRYLSLLHCLGTDRKQKLVTLSSLQDCQQTKRLPAVARLFGLQTEEGGEKVVANKRFSLFFQVFDQHNLLFVDEEAERPTFAVHINSNNKQGAVMVGFVTNRTDSQGMLRFQDLMITQPGPLDLTVLLKQKDGQSLVLASLRLMVQENPLYRDSSHCLYVFTNSQCSALDSEEEASRLFPTLRSFYDPAGYLSHLSCSEKTAVWQVKAYSLASGGMVADYRMGLESIWTGINMIHAEMSMLERLGISQTEIARFNATQSKRHKALDTADYNRGMLKLIKRAYYKSSLQWHPDRWAGYDQYHYAIQAAFQLVTEAYETLQAEYSSSPTQEPVFE
eukprot:gene1395-1516_t